jgi:hypothetical protein
LIASAGRFGTEAAVTPVRGHVCGGGGGGVGEAEGGGAALAGAAVLPALWLQPAITRAAASATTVHRHACPRILSIWGFLLIRATALPDVSGAGGQYCSASDAGKGQATGQGCPHRYHRSMDDLKPRLADAESKLSHVKEYL